MHRKTKIWISIGVLLFFGLGFVAMGVAAQYIVQNYINDGLDDLYMKSSDHDSWGEVPGEIGTKVVRSFVLFNISNPEEIFQGGKPRLIEIPQAPFQEYSKFNYWSYVNDDGKEEGKDDEEDLVAYNYELDLVELANNSTTVPPDTPITFFSLDRYALFYGLAHQAAPFYGHQNLHDVVLTFQKDMYDGVTAYSIFYSNLTDPAAVTAQIELEGFTQEQATIIATDITYGWGNWQALKYWIQALQYYETTQNSVDDVWDKLNNYFQIADLYKLVDKGSFLYQAFEDVKADMLERYGTNDRVELGHLQWSDAKVISNMPFGVASPVYTIPGTTLEIPSYLGMNSTFNFIPEIYLAAPLLNVAQTDFSDITDTLLEVDETYPMTNTQSVLNLDIVGKYFTYILEKDIASAMQLLDLNSPQQAQALAYYIVYLGSLPIQLKDGTTQSSDGYSLILSKWARKAMVNNYNTLYDDAFYGTHAATLFCKYSQADITCSDVMKRTITDSAKADTICTSKAGWDIQTNSWENLILWTNSALKDSSSNEFSELMSLSNTTSDELNGILYTDITGMKSDVLTVAKEISAKYSCTKDICTYDELYYLQWGSSGITLNPPTSLSKCFSTSRSMKDWLPNHYQTFPEWYADSDIVLSSSVSKQFISYSGFLNPTPIRMFFNSYYKGNQAATAAKFGFPSELIVGYFYEYLINSIPSFNMIPTLPYRSIIDGYVDELFSFVYSMNTLEGGVPTAIPFRQISASTYDTEAMPKHQMHSGKDNSGDIRTFTQYYGHEVMDKYGPEICTSCENGLTFGYSDIWDGNLTISGTDGGAFGPDVDSEDTPKVYLNTILREVQMKFTEDLSYEGLTVKKFVIDDDWLKTSEYYEFNKNFNQYPNGFNGYMNLTNIFNAPVFIGHPHCLGCEEAGINMAEFYEYTTDSSEYLLNRIHPTYKYDDSYAYVEPTTGVTVSIMLKLSLSAGIYEDYFFNSIYQPVDGKGLYLPSLTIVRSYNLTEDQIDDNFGDLFTAWTLQKYSLPIGLAIGGTFLLISLILLAWQYRIRRAEIRATMAALLAEKYRDELE